MRGARRRERRCTTQEHEQRRDHPSSDHCPGCEATHDSYRGVKTNYSSTEKIKEGSKIEESTDCQTIPEKIDLNSIKIPTHFEWTDGGNVVYITGNFSNWTQWFMMNKLNGNKFTLNLVNNFYMSVEILY